MRDCDYCGKALAFSGREMPSGAFACVSCEVEHWGTEHGLPVTECQSCGRETSSDITDGECDDCAHERFIASRDGIRS
jgi:hypothetical protein